MPPRKKRRSVPRHADTAEQPIRPAQDIGPVYRFFGVCGLVAIVVVFLVERLHDHRLEWVVLAGYGIAAVVCIFLIRPAVVDGWVKRAATILPSKITKYDMTSGG